MQQGASPGACHAQCIRTNRLVLESRVLRDELYGDCHFRHGDKLEYVFVCDLVVFFFFIVPLSGPTMPKVKILGAIP